MTHNAYEVRTLLRIGYHPKVIIRQFFLYFVKVFGLIATLGLAMFFIFKFFLDDMFASGGLYIDTALSYQSISALAIAFGIFTWASFRTANKGIFKEY